MLRSLVGSEMCIRDSQRRVREDTNTMAIFEAELHFFDALNLFLLAGWVIALYQLFVVSAHDPAMRISPFDQPCSPWLGSVLDPIAPQGSSPLWNLIFCLEIGCWVDVLRMMAGNLRGNLPMGVVLHSVRTVFLLLPAAPAGSHSHSVRHIVLIAWAVTEIARYPYYIWNTSGACKALRFAVPMVTFPIGAGFEFISAWLFLQDKEVMDSALTMAATGMLATNSIGGLMAYPGMVNKGLQALTGNKQF
eukprot:TRINITY_DN9508_c0_g1_i9.p1 TRINITY_DN9508_c0_g1~~TRINITY_DN9508_c0_g1_i9.p1  ORF type:complete len:248 (-),score=59.12 TRINITY_DN9508_c0_g1_i9:458-1201(-)